MSLLKRLMCYETKSSPRETLVETLDRETLIETLDRETLVETLDS